MKATRASAQERPGQCASNPAADQAERGQAEMAEDQRPAEQGVDRRCRRCSATGRPAAARARRRNCASAGTAATARCTTYRRAGTSGRSRPAPDPGRRRAGSRRYATAPASRTAAMTSSHRPGAKGAADVAHRVRAPAERGGHHRRGGSDQPEQEHVEGVGEVERQRRRGEWLAGPAAPSAGRRWR